ncbi:MAG: ABC transporter ATP-binding protein [Gaiellaceae bacterium]
MDAALLAGRGLTRRYGAVCALAPVDVEVHRGESLALVGPNGAGKSTLLSILAGALSPSAGTVRTAGGVRVGWLPQRPAHYGRLTAGENLELFARLEGEPDPRGRAAELVSHFDLPESRLSGRLSVGNRQRLNLAIALLGRPDVLLLDEPSASLDPEQRARLWEEVEAHRAAGGGVVFSSQYHEEVDHHAQRVIALRDGAVAFAGSAVEFAALGWQR